MPSQATPPTHLDAQAHLLEQGALVLRGEAVLLQQRTRPTTHAHAQTMGKAQVWLGLHRVHHHMLLLLHLHRRLLRLQAHAGRQTNRLQRRLRRTLQAQWRRNPLLLRWQRRQRG